MNKFMSLPVLALTVCLSICLLRQVWGYGDWLEKTPVGGMTLGPGPLPKCVFPIQKDVWAMTLRPVSVPAESL